MARNTKSVQIICPTDHFFNLQLNDLKEILGTLDDQNRYVVVVSIAGAFRKGKSFLLNFFLKYLHAQYKKHDVTNWLGEDLNIGNSDGFKFRGGQKPETTGIWMWSEIFTHDFDNGDKVAIIVLDTQGIFDHEASKRDCAVIFALSMMLSSVQCYNVMQNVQEDDLENLELFTEYGRLAVDHTNEKAFQKLIFVIRDWPYADEDNYGWNNGVVVNNILAENKKQNKEMRQLRANIKNSFSEITAFLMPYPGKAVAQGRHFSGRMSDIDPEFLDYIKVLVPGLFSPEKLIIKKINGRKMRVSDLVVYLEVYTDVFNGISSIVLPNITTLLGATAEAFLTILLNDCSKMYITEMRTIFQNCDTFFNDAELNGHHEQQKFKAITKYSESRKLGTPDLISTHQQKLEQSIEEQFVLFEEDNIVKRKSFIEKANLHNDALSKELSDAVKNKILEEVHNLESDLQNLKLADFFKGNKDNALDQFNERKMGDSEIPQAHYDNLVSELEHFESVLMKVWVRYNNCLNHYHDTIKKWMREVAEESSEQNTLSIHQSSKKEAITKFEENKELDKHRLLSTFLYRVEHEIESKLEDLEKDYEKQRIAYIEKAKRHNSTLSSELIVSFDKEIRRQLALAYRNDEEFECIFSHIKNDILQKFDSRKIGTDQLFQQYREELHQEIESTKGNMEEINEGSKPASVTKSVKKLFVCCIREEN